MLGSKMWCSLTRLVNTCPLKLYSERSISTVSSTLFFKFTPYLYAEPLKRKKRLDPAILRAREERKKKKLEKQIRRLEKNARQLKPLEEIETPFISESETNARRRDSPLLSESQLEGRALLMKEWTRYRHKQHLADFQQIDMFLRSQQKALDELRAESEELYLEAIQIDQGLVPIKLKGPVRTPPIKDYESPDGEYIDISKKWD